MVRQEKIDQVENIKEKLSKSSVSILTDYRGLSGAEITGLRKKLRGNNAEYKVFKNTLAKRAVADAEFGASRPPWGPGRGPRARTWTWTRARS